MPAPCRATATPRFRCTVGTLAPGQEARITITSRPASYAACQAQNNPGARAVADGNLSATDTGAPNCVRPELDVQKTPMAAPSVRVNR